MKAPISWLKDHVDIKVDIKEYADRMTMSGSKVEGITKLYDDIKNIVVGKIVNIKDHPEADKLLLCDVDTGGEQICVVTGAKNLKTGDVVPVALDGAVLPDGKVISKGTLRGVLSQGMLCSLTELGLEAADYPYAIEDGIFVLQGNYIIGEDIIKALGLRDDVVEFEITSNRPDCLSIQGIALESAVTFGEDYRPGEIIVREEGNDVKNYIDVEISDGELCPVYAARVCTDIKIGPSPDWMRKRLRASGVRPINNVVDITNYVMLERGQPMHAFDINYINGNKIIVRRAKENETITTLDEMTRQLDAEDLVIADCEKAIALAGVMGGENSEIKDDTVTVVFESANFEPANIRRTSKKVGLRTESSIRFEKGLDPQNAIDSINRACQLMEILNAGKVCKGSIIRGDWVRKEAKVPFDPEKINKILGSDITKEYMINILSALKFEVREDYVIPPGFRNDIELIEDIAEEIARFHDYNSIKPTLPRTGSAGAGLRTKRQALRLLVTETLISTGFHEAYTISFSSPKVFDRLRIEPEDAVVIMNPLGEEYSMMRTNLYDGMLRSLSINYNRRVKNAALFEMAKVYIPNMDGGLPKEPEKISLGAYGDTDFFDIKGSVEILMDMLGITGYEFMQETKNRSYHPGRCAVLKIKDETAGIFGQVHPDVAAEYELPRETYMGMLDFETLYSNAVFEKQHTKLPKYPSVNRDIALVLDDDIQAAVVEKMIKETGGKLLESVELFDVYKGERIGENKKSLAYSLVWRDQNKTLSDQDIALPMNDILDKLKTELNVELRQI